MDGVPGVVEDGSGFEVMLTHAEGLLDVPQFMVMPNDFTASADACGDISDIALEPHETLSALEPSLVKGEAFPALGYEAGPASGLGALRWRLWLGVAGR